MKTSALTRVSTTLLGYSQVQSESLVDPSIKTQVRSTNERRANKKSYITSIGSATKLNLAFLAALVCLSGNAQTTSTNAFSAPTFNDTWSEDSSIQASDLADLNSTLGTLSQASADYTYRLDSIGARYFTLSGQDDDGYAETPTLVLKTDAQNQSIYLDYETTPTISFTIGSRKDDDSTNRGSANTLSLTITLLDVNEKPVVLAPYNTPSVGRQIYLEVQQGLASQPMINIRQVFRDPEGSFIRLKECADDFEIVETVGGSPQSPRGDQDVDYDVSGQTPASRHCASPQAQGYDASADVRAGGSVVNIRQEFQPSFFTIVPVPATTATTNTAKITFNGWVGAAIDSGADFDDENKTPDAIITVHVRTGVNNPPSWSAVGFRAEVFETDVAGKLGPPQGQDGTWNATDIDGDPLTYMLIGVPAGPTCTDGSGSRIEDAIALGPACVWLVLNSGQVELWGTNFDYEVGAKSQTIQLEASDGYPTGTRSIPIEIVIKNVDEPIVAPTDIPQLKSLLLGREGRSADLNDYFRDPEGEMISYSVQTEDRGIVSATVDGSTLTINPLLAGSESVFISPSTPGRAEATFTLTVNVRETNSPPSFEIGAATIQLSVAENTPLGTTVPTSTLRYTDPDNDPVTVQILGQAPVSGVVDSDAGLVNFRVTGNLDHETNSSYQFQVQLNDGWDNSGQLVTVLLNVVDINEAPFLRQGQSIPPQQVSVNGVASFNVGQYFSDPEDERLIVKVPPNAGGIYADVEVETASTTTIKITGKQATVSPVEIRFTVEDNSGLATSATFSLTVSPNAAPVVTGVIPNQAIHLGETKDVPLVGIFTDPDPGDRIASFSAATSNDLVLLVRVPAGADYVTLIGRGEGSATVVVTALDSRGGSAQTSFGVTVIGNQPPVVVVRPSNATLVRSETHTVDLTTIFNDPDADDTLTYQATSTSTTVASIDIAGDTLTVTANGVGKATIVVTATDSESETATARFEVEVENIAPKVVGTIADQTTNRNEDVEVDIAAVFSDDDGDALTYTLDVADTRVATASISGTTITIDPVDLGSTSITVTAADAFGGEADISFMVTVINLAPVVAQQISPVALQLGGDSVDRDLSGVFTDDGDDLTLAVEVDDTTVATVALDSMMLTVSAVASGTATLTVTATDTHDASVSTTASITVSDSELKAVGVNALAGFGRSVLAGVSSSVGGRLLSESDLSYGSLTALGSTDDDPNASTAWADSRLNPSLVAQQSGWGSFDENESDVPMASYSADDMLYSLLGDKFFLNLGALGDPMYYSIWGSFSTNSFEGAAYEGDANGFFVGADLTLNGQWTFGLAYGNNSGEADYTFGTASRKMENSLNTILPYIRVTPSERTTIYGVIGFGSGEMETAVGGTAETSDLSSSIGLFGGKQVMYAGATGLTVAIQGDFGYANMETDDAEVNASSGFVADVSRIRGGVEGSMNLAMGVDGAMVPYLNLSFRSDGGDGETGSGVELSGGVRMSSPGFSVDAHFRTLLTSGVDDYSETGFSATATINPGRRATGFKMSISPRWGADARGSDLLWNDNVNMNTLDRYLMPDVLKSENTLLVSSKMSYGLNILSDRMNLRPYMTINARNQQSTNILFGTELVRGSAQGRQLTVGVEVGEQGNLGIDSQETARIRTKIAF